MAVLTHRDVRPVCLALMLFFLLTHSVAGVSVGSCAFQLRCTCITYSDGRTKVSCNRQELTTVPAPTHRNSTASFYLEGNIISTIVPGTFMGMSKLEWLSLNDNKLRSVPSDVFSDLPKLKHLDLSRNKIRSVAKDAFRSLPRLEWLKMSDNRLTSIDGGIFSDLTKLGEFFLDGNKLASIGQDAFIGLSALRYLMLFGNEIGSIEKGSFTDLTSLLGLHLAGNRLTVLDGEDLVKLKKLAYISVDNNPWHCDCRLQNLVDYLKQNRANIKTPSGQAAPLPNCTTPPALFGRGLLSLTAETLREQCLLSSQPPKPSPPPTPKVPQTTTATTTTAVTTTITATTTATTTTVPTTVATTTAIPSSSVAVTIATSSPRPVLPTRQPTSNANSQKSVRPTGSHARESARWATCDKQHLIVALATVSAVAVVLAIIVIAGGCYVIRRRHTGEADLQKSGELGEEFQLVKKPE